jgi:hypothetical protein
MIDAFYIAYHKFRGFYDFDAEKYLHNFITAIKFQEKEKTKAKERQSRKETSPLPTGSFGLRQHNYQSVGLHSIQY